MDYETLKKETAEYLLEMMKRKPSPDQMKETAEMFANAIVFAIEKSKKS